MRINVNGKSKPQPAHLGHPSRIYKIFKIYTIYQDDV